MRADDHGSGLVSFGKSLIGSFGAIRSTTGSDLVLTFDDGPDPDRTLRMLDVLSAHGATATFFVLLTRTRQHPSVLSAIKDAGHEVGLHGPDHRALSDYPHAQALERTRAARGELEDALGEQIRWFRPPYGSQSLSSFLAVRRAGLDSVLWSATTWDWKAVPNQERIDKALMGAKSGAIVLAHDGQADANDLADETEDPHCDSVVLMDRLLKEFAERGLVCRSLGEVLDHSRPRRTPRFTKRPPSTTTS